MMLKSSSSYASSLGEKIGLSSAFSLEAPLERVSVLDSQRTLFSLEPDFADEGRAHFMIVLRERLVGGFFKSFFITLREIGCSHSTGLTLSFGKLAYALQASASLSSSGHCTKP